MQLSLVYSSDARYIRPLLDPLEVGEAIAVVDARSIPRAERYRDVGELDYLDEVLATRKNLINYLSENPWAVKFFALPVTNDQLQIRDGYHQGTLKAEDLSSLSRIFKKVREARQGFLECILPKNKFAFISNPQMYMNFAKG